MLNPDVIAKQLKLKNHKMTRIRGLIIELFINSSTPISASNIINAFSTLKISANRTTIYREIIFLMKEKIIQEVDFGEGKKRYELLSDEHHHHLICTKCDMVEDIFLDTDLHKEEEEVFKDLGFKITSHSLEFFGLCKNCQKQLASD